MATSTSGLILRTARAAAGLSQIEVARKSGISANRLCEFERGKRPLRPDVARRVWDALVESGVAGERDGR